MRKGLTLVAKAVLFVAVSPCWSGNIPSQSVPPANDNRSHQPKIEKFLNKKSVHLSKSFPYRINLFTQGQIDKNSAGLRISETASQF